MKIKWIKSPHYRKGRKLKIKSIVIHYISAVNVNPDDPFNVKSVLKLLTEPIKWNGKKYRVSAHYCIDREGKIYQLVKDEDVAWHAGKSELHGTESYNGSCNEFSIGVELIGGNWKNFTEKQYESLAKLLYKLKVKYDIPEKNIVGHEDIAPERKIDPGKHFEWDKCFNLIEKEKQNNLKKERKKNNTEIHAQQKKIMDNKILPNSNITDGRDLKEKEKNNINIFIDIFNAIKNFINRIKI